jgi:hypothetical protein
VLAKRFWRPRESSSPQFEAEVPVGQGEVGVERLAVVVRVARGQGRRSNAEGGEGEVAYRLAVRGDVQLRPARVQVLQEAGDADFVERGPVAVVVEEGLEGASAQGQLVAPECVDAFRDDVDDAEHRARPVEDGARATHDLDALDVVDGQVQVHRGGAAEDAVVEPHPVDGDEHVLGASRGHCRGHAAHHDARAPHSIGEHLQTGHRLQDLAQRACPRTADVFLRDHGHETRLLVDRARALLTGRDLQEHREVDVVDVAECREALDEARAFVLLRGLGRRRLFGRRRGRGRQLGGGNGRGR